SLGQVGRFVGLAKRQLWPEMPSKQRDLKHAATACDCTVTGIQYYKRTEPKFVKQNVRSSRGVATIGATLAAGVLRLHPADGIANERTGVLEFQLFFYVAAMHIHSLRTEA